jgi:hypothetical protein
MHRKNDIKHLAELALIRAIPDLVVGGLKKGRLKSLMTRLQKAVDLDLAKLRQPTQQDLDLIWEVVDTFRRESGWGKKHHHPATIACFCLAIIDRSDRRFNTRIIAMLNEISEYYDRVGDLRRPSLWAADLACRKWLALFGIHERDDGVSAEERIMRIDADIARAAAMDEYQSKLYPESVGA